MDYQKAIFMAKRTLRSEWKQVGTDGKVIIGHQAIDQLSLRFPELEVKEQELTKKKKFAQSDSPFDEIVQGLEEDGATLVV